MITNPPTIHIQRRLRESAGRVAPMPPAPPAPPEVPVVLPKPKKTSRKKK